MTQKKEMTGAQILVQSLIDQGVDTIFGYPGGAVLDIYDALYEASDRIFHLETSHEQHACHAADGYARATGRTGVVLATSGPGATNLVTGIATAYLDSVPLVAITGNVANPSIGTDAFQEVDITGITLPITKHSFFVRDVSRLQEIVCEAFALAQLGRPGPVLIDIPKDVQNARHTYSPISALNAASEQPTGEDPAQAAGKAPAQVVGRESAQVASAKPVQLPDEATIQEAARIINEAQRPFIYFGGGAAFSCSGERIITLAERICAPMASSLMGISAVPTKHPLYLGMQGMHGHYAATMALNGCDCLIALGVRFNDRATGDRTRFAPNHKIVRVDIDSSELSKTVYDQIDLVGDVATILDKLLELIRPNTHKDWHQEVQNMRAQEKGFADYRETLTPKTVMEAINACRAADMPVATDVGQHQMWAAQHLSFSQPRTFISSGGLGTMGFGLGAAIGAHMGSKKRSLLVTGDGSFGMNLGELATIADNNLPITIVLLNNGVLGMVRQWQTLFYSKRYSHTTFEHAFSYVDVASAFGVQAVQAQTPEELAAALKMSLAQDGPMLIECAIDSNEFVTPMVPPGGSVEDLMVNEDDIRAKVGE